MEKTVRLQWLESELERLRMKLYQISSQTSASHLSHSQMLPVSEQLDVVIVEFMKEQRKQKN